MQMNTIVLNADKYEKMLKELGMLKTENEELKKSLPTSHNSDYAKLKEALESIADCGGCLTGEDAQEMKQVAIEALQ